MNVHPGEAVAVVGVCVRVAGAPDTASFWSMVRSGRGGRRVLTEAELDRRGVPPARYREAGYVPAHYPLAGAVYFDSAAFGLGPAEAQLTDPQHRVLLQACYTAVQSAGHDIGALPGVVGVYLGAKASTHGALLERELGTGADELELTRLAVGNHPDYLASRVSYRYGLRGPAMTVQTACSTSAVAIHLAAQAILGGECDSALAGGVAVDLQDAGYRWAEGGIYSRRGRCEPYTTSADGTVEGNGVAVVFLRRLDCALASGDPVLGVIAGTAVNNDGRDRAGFAAPSVSGQAAVIAEALDVAGIGPDRIGLFEGHGTGTELGDALEVQAAAGVYRDRGAGPARCRLHSVKANVGHLSAAAGAAGVAAALLAMRHHEVPPNLPLVEGATAIDTSGTPFVLSATPTAWPASAHGRYAAVSSFGLGGTNAHIIVAELPAGVRPARTRHRRWQLLPLSADDPQRLAGAVEDARAAVDAQPATVRHDVAHTLRTGRPALVVRTTATIPAGSDAAPSWPAAGSGTQAAVSAPDLIFLLPGQGGMDADQAHQLYRDEPAFAATVERGLSVMRDALTTAAHAATRAVFTEGEPYVGTEVAQPVLHLIAVGAGAFLHRLGIRPGAVVGHSVGELSAAYLCGVLGFDDAARMVCRRGEAMAAMAPGAMFAVRAGTDELGGLPTGSCVAVRNAPNAVVLAVGADQEAQLLAWLDGRRFEHRRLHTAHAFHHPSMAGAAAAFGRHLRTVALRPPRVPLGSCRTGRWLSDTEATDPDHWAMQVREPVDFAGALLTVAADRPDARYVQIGPGTGMVRSVQLCGTPATRCVALLPGHGAEAQQTLLQGVGRLWEHGVPVDWSTYSEGDTGRRIDTLPRRFRDTPVLHPALVPYAYGADPDDLAAGPTDPTGSTGDRPDPDDRADPLLAAVATDWAAVLGAPPQPDDDFLACGGDSITASRLVALLRSQFPVDLPMHLPLTARTLRGLAAAIDEALIAEVSKA